MIKQFLSQIKRCLFFLPVLAFLASCGNTAPTSGNLMRDGKPSIVCTVFPQYDWVRQILGEDAGGYELTLLQTSQVDLHNFQPSVSDIVKISACDLFICVGGESDAWVEDALAEAANPDMTVIKMLDVLGENAKEEEVTAGMELEEEEEEAAYDEHVWMSLRNAEILCGAICDALAEDKYADNLETYIEKLKALDERYTTELRGRTQNTLVFADRFPFRYLTDDYAIDYFAAFPGCSADTEAGFETLVFLTEKIDELGLKNIMVTENSDGTIADVIRDDTGAGGQTVLVLNAMQSVTAAMAGEGVTYLGIMEENLNILKEALCS